MSAVKMHSTALPRSCFVPGEMVKSDGLDRIKLPASEGLPDTLASSELRLPHEHFLRSCTDS